MCPWYDSLVDSPQSTFGEDLSFPHPLSLPSFSPYPTSPYYLVPDTTMAACPCLPPREKPIAGLPSRPCVTPHCVPSSRIQLRLVQRCRGRCSVYRCFALFKRQSAWVFLALAPGRRWRRRTDSASRGYSQPRWVSRATPSPIAPAVSLQTPSRLRHSTSESSRSMLSPGRPIEGAWLANRYLLSTAYIGCTCTTTFSFRQTEAVG